MLVKKLRSKNYPTVIEVLCPVRFYWNKNSYDGFEFGPLDGSTKYQRKLLGKIIEQLGDGMDTSRVVAYLKQNHLEVYHKVLDEIEADNKALKGIPNEFIDAFEDKEEN